MAKVLAVCVSEKKGVQKHPVDRAELRANHGLVGDAPAGPWHRQGALVGIDSVRNLQVKITLQLKPGDFAENILVEGLTVYKLRVGTELKLGSARCRVTQIGKTCHMDCAIRKAAGDCVMPREGIFVEVLEGGEVRPGDEIQVIEA